MGFNSISHNIEPLNQIRLMLDTITCWIKFTMKVIPLYLESRESALFKIKNFSRARTELIATVSLTFSLYGSSITLKFGYYNANIDFTKNFVNNFDL